MFRKPVRVKPGDRVGIFLASSPVREPFRSNGIRALIDLGFLPVEVDGVFERHDFLARPPEASFADIQSFWADESIAALWAGRGGYGSQYLFPSLSGLSVMAPKAVIGSSDASCLLWYLLDRFRMVVFYGPMAYASLAEGKFNRENLMRTLSGDFSEMKIGGKALHGGEAEGIVTGGCLSSLASLIGTPYFPEVKDRILLLEDQNERPYKLDRMFWQIGQQGVFRRVRGLILGEFPGCFLDEAEKQNFLDRVGSIREAARVPILYDMPFGHSADCHMLPLGIRVEISASPSSGLLIREKGVKG